MPERISGLRAKRMQRQPDKGFVFAYFFHARNHITFCQVILRQILSRRPIHSVPGRPYFHEITLRDNPPFHPLPDLDAGKNLRVTGKKKATTA